MIVGPMLRRATASLKMSRRSSADSRASLSIRTLFGDFLKGGVNPARRCLLIEQNPLPEGRIELPAHLRNDFGCDAAVAECFQRLHDQRQPRAFEELDCYSF